MYNHICGYWFLMQVENHNYCDVTESASYINTTRVSSGRLGLGDINWGEQCQTLEWSATRGSGDPQLFNLTLYMLSIHFLWLAFLIQWIRSLCVVGLEFSWIASFGNSVAFWFFELILGILLSEFFNSYYHWVSGIYLYTPIYVAYRFWT